MEFLKQHDNVFKEQLHAGTIEEVKQLMPRLFDILIHFRSKIAALVGDIENAFFVNYNF